MHIIENIKLFNGDCLNILKELQDNSVDSIVTDPPYELCFMGKAWDNTGIAYNVELWKECLRVLKHGGHMLAFGGTRTYHRMACAIEDAGFEIRDQMQWIYGSGFPKSMNISKQIDKKAGAEREVVGTYKTPNGRDYTLEKSCQDGYNKTELSMGKDKGVERRLITTPSTELAKQWEGWGTALKPANEPICVARKPISEKTVSDNVIRWGVGGINIDDCRVEYKNEADINIVKAKCNFTENSKSIGFGTADSIYGEGITSLEQANQCVKENGRFPANIIFDEVAAQMLDKQSGNTKSGKVKENKESYDCDTVTKFLKGVTTTDNQYGDEGGASRFFYCAKASKKERNEGIDNVDIANIHPTVKPIKLMEYLIKLITPPDGICLDMFMGSGTTGKACINLDINFIGIELDNTYFKIAEERIQSA